MKDICCLASIKLFEFVILKEEKIPFSAADLVCQGATPAAALRCTGGQDLGACRGAELEVTGEETRSCLVSPEKPEEQRREAGEDCRSLARGRSPR